MNKFIKAIAAIMLIVEVINVVGCKKNENTEVKVTTYVPQTITSISAECGGDAIVVQGLSLTEIGVCWSKEQNPTGNKAHLSTTLWNEPFVCTIKNLEPNTRYYVRAYALRGLVYYYGDEKSFVTNDLSGVVVSGTYQNHDYVDLRLPSRTMWATCNVGAEVPEGYGDYFAWGETEPKDDYWWDTYKYCKDGHNQQLTKYCSDSTYGYNGFTDNLIVLEPSDDVATVRWGVGWRMPTEEGWLELCSNTTIVRTTQNGVNGFVFIGSNGNRLFLPAAGSRWSDEFSCVDTLCSYWSSSLCVDYPFHARSFTSYHFGTMYGNRDDGQSVRAVCFAP